MGGDFSEFHIYIYIYILKNSSCHLEGGILSAVNKCLEYVLNKWVNGFGCRGQKVVEEKLEIAVETVEDGGHHLLLQLTSHLS